MDPTGMETAKALAAGDAKFILAVGVVALIAVAVWLGRALYAEMKACNAQMLDLITKKIESDNKLAGALEGVEKIVETALRTVKA